MALRPVNVQVKYPFTGKSSHRVINQFGRRAALLHHANMPIGCLVQRAPLLNGSGKAAVGFKYVLCDTPCAQKTITN